MIKGFRIWKLKREYHRLVTRYNDLMDCGRYTDCWLMMDRIKSIEEALNG